VYINNNYKITIDLLLNVYILSVDKFVDTILSTYYLLQLQHKQGIIIFNFNKGIPVWFMRQAGRYLPEYNQTKFEAGSFLDLCYNPKLVKEVTLQPLRRFDFDAAIIFSDILLVLQALGSKLVFEKNMGPILSGENIAFKEVDFVKKLSPVYESIKITRQALIIDKELIGFVGAPFTLLSYLIAKQKVSDRKEYILSCINKNFGRALRLLNILEKAVELHLIKQIESGATIVKIFDSWAGMVSDDDLYKEIIINSTKRVVEKVRKVYPEIPIMAFPRGSGEKYVNYVKIVKPDIVTVDYDVDVRWAQSNLANMAILQGNLNPSILLGGKSEIAKFSKKIINIFGKNKFIFNLGHGILPTTPIENVKYLIDIVKNG